MISFRVLTPFVAGFVLAVLFVPIVRRMAIEIGAVSQSRSDRWHRRPVPMLGGIALWAGAVIPAMFLLPWDRFSLIAMAGGTSMFLLGALDDFVKLKPSSKFVGQLIVSCLVVAAGLRLHWFPSPALDALITIGWIVGITNAFNLLDNMDGLSAGIALIASVALGVIALKANVGGATIAALLSGVCAAFLLYNFPPASIFMGDSGSLFLGATLAILTLADVPGGGRGLMSALAVPALLMLIPIFDTTLVAVSRRLSARPASSGGSDHSSHRLVALGFSERQAVLLLWAFAAAGGTAAVMFDSPEISESNLFTGLLLIALILLAIRLVRVRVYPEGDFRKLRDGRYTLLIAQWTYRRRIFEIVLDLLIVSFAYYAAYVIRFDEDVASHYERFVQSLPLVIACTSGSLLAVGAYQGFWRYFSSPDLITYAKGIALGSVSSIVVLSYMYHFAGYSRGVFIVFTLLSAVLVTGSRLSFRLVADLARRQGANGPRLLIYGAGDGGALALREVRQNRQLNYRIVGFVDDDVLKVGKRVMGIPVLDSSDRLAELIARLRVEVLLLATDNIDADRKIAVERICFASGTSLLRLRFAFEPVPVDVHKG
jgi:UDP-GlcNAc:undecaprenyl-phosphate/decaprenyl-phosphate GlcNAc-1-phosphate transferase